MVGGGEPVAEHWKLYVYWSNFIDFHHEITISHLDGNVAALFNNHIGASRIVEDIWWNWKSTKQVCELHTI